MQTLKIVSTLIAAILLVIISQVIQEASVNITIVDITIYTKFSYSVLLLLSFIYLHYSFYHYINPITKLTAQQKKKISSVMFDYYKSSFFYGTIGLGYVLLLMTLIPLFNPDVVFDSSGYLLTSVLLVIFGTVSKARGLMLFLLNEYNKQ